MILFDTKYLQLKSTKSKSGSDWVYAHRPNVTGGVVILPVINNSKVLFLIEERPPIKAEKLGKYTIGLPAGLMGDVRADETAVDAIKAELLEETGLVADKIEIVTKKVATSPGCVSENFYIAKAYINKYELSSEPVSDGGIICDRVLVDIKNIKKWLTDREDDGYILTAQMLAALFYLND